MGNREGIDTRGVFLRKASGVVRNVSLQDVFIYNVGLINIGIGIAFILLLGPAFYPGVSMILGTLLVATGCIFQALTYYFFSVSMPRSGGDYVFISRGLHPALGFVMSFNMVVWLLFYSAWSAGAMGFLGLTSFFGVLGQTLGNSAYLDTAIWVASSQGIFVIGTIMLLISAVILISGMKRFVLINNILMYISIIGILVMLGVLLSSTHDAFVTGFNSNSGGITYDGVIDKAKATGWGEPSMSYIIALLGFMIWPFYPLAFSIMSSSFAGEIKNVKKSQLFGMPGAVAFAAFFIVALIIAANRVMGYEFLGAIGWNYYVNPDYSTSVIPWIAFLTSMLTDNIALTTFINLSFALWTWFWIPGCMLYGTRVILAWGLDRLMPETLGKVSDKYNTPVNATILTFIVAEIFLALIAFTEYFATLVGIAAMVVTFVFIGISGIVFPFIKKEVFEKSPINYRIGPIPVMSLLGIATAIFMSIMLYPFFTDTIGGASTSINRIAIAIVFILGVVIFYVTRYIRKTQGIDVDLAYKEIPVE